MPFPENNQYAKVAYIGVKCFELFCTILYIKIAYLLFCNFFILCSKFKYNQITYIIITIFSSFILQSILRRVYRLHQMAKGSMSQQRLRTLPLKPKKKGKAR